MSSAGTWAPGPLTTIFTPPAGCFEQLPQLWQLCDTPAQSDGNVSVSCYWSLPTRCFPPNAATASFTTGLEYVIAYHYSPGVLPSGFTTWEAAGPSAHAGVALAIGCPSGWGGTVQYTWCRSLVVGDYVLQSSTMHGSTFAAVVPQVAVWWASSDLSFFTPASAPVLPTWRIDRYESSVAARSRSAMATSTAATNPIPTGSTPQSESKGSSTGGLSPGAKAGIAVGIVIAVLSVLAFGFLVLRRRKQGRTIDKSQALQRKESRRPYLDSKGELPASENAKQANVGAAELGLQSPRELHGNSLPTNIEAAELGPRSPQELPSRSPPDIYASSGSQERAANQHLPPPVPLASKPRFEESDGNHATSGGL